MPERIPEFISFRKSDYMANGMPKHLSDSISETV